MSQRHWLMKLAFGRSNAEAECVEQEFAGTSLVIAHSQDQNASIADKGLDRLYLFWPQASGRRNHNEQSRPFEAFWRQVGQRQGQVAVSHEGQGQSADTVGPPRFIAVGPEVRRVEVGQIVGAYMTTVGQRMYAPLRHNNADHEGCRGDCRDERCFSQTRLATEQSKQDRHDQNCGHLPPGWVGGGTGEISK